MTDGDDQAERDRQQAAAEQASLQAGRAIEEAGAMHWPLSRLRDLSDAELIRWDGVFMAWRYVGNGPDDFRNELNRRKADRAADTLIKLTRWLIVLTVALVLLTFVIAGMTMVLIGREG